MQSIVVKIQANLTYFSEMLQGGETLFKQVDIEHDNLRLAIQDGLRYEETVEKSAELTLTSSDFIARYGYWYHWLTLLQQVIEACSANHKAVRFRIQIMLADAHNRSGNLDEALNVLQDATVFAQMQEDDELILLVDFHYSTYYLNQQKYRLARQHLTHILEATSTTNRPRFWLAATNLLGIVALETGDFKIADDRFSEVVDFVRGLDNKLFLRQLLHNWGNALREQGLFKQAKTKYSEAVSYIPGGEMSKEKAMLQISQGELHSAQKQWELAKIAFASIEKPYLRQNGHTTLLALVHYHQGKAAFALGDYQSAEVSTAEARQLFRRVENQIMYAKSLGQFGKIIYREDRARAEKLFKNAITILEHYPDNWLAKEARTDFEQWGGRM